MRLLRPKQISVVVLLLLAALASAPPRSLRPKRASTAGFSRDAARREDGLPFAPGEKLEYAIRFGPIHVGSGDMELARGDSVRGEPTYHATFRLRGGTFFFRVD